MADQKRWWKFWCTAPSDELLQRIPPAHRWAWAVLGTYTKAHGDNGRVVISETNMVLSAEMGVSCSDLISVIKTFPHVVIEECKNRHGEFTVTWQNWVKYQEDSTQAERARASRSKRRGEEKRREETKEKKQRTKAPVVDTPGLPLEEKRLGPYQAMVASYFWTFEKEHKVRPVITPADGKNASKFCEGKEPELTAWLAWEYLTNPTDYAATHYRFSLRDIVMDSANLLGRPRKRPLPKEIAQLIGGSNGGDDRKKELPGEPVRNNQGSAPIVNGSGEGGERKS